MITIAPICPFAGLAIAIFSALLAPLTASAQRPTPDDIDEMFQSSTSSEDYRMTYYKWAPGTPIKVLVVTDRQRGMCVDIQLAEIYRQVGLIRELVPELRNMQDPEAIDWLPETKLKSVLVLGLEGKNKTIQQAMLRYGKANTPRAQFLQTDRSTHLVGNGDGFGIESGHIVYAYGWTTTSGGLAIYSEQICRGSSWDTLGLVTLLGETDFSTIKPQRWLNGATSEKQKVWREFVMRLFLKALYACPGTPVGKECVKNKIKALAVDPSLAPAE